jgi:hypothetical protein
MRTFLADGTWNVKACAFFDMADVLVDAGNLAGDDDDDEFEDENSDNTGHWYTAEEFYYILTSVYHISPELVTAYGAILSLLQCYDQQASVLGDADLPVGTRNGKISEKE